MSSRPSTRTPGSAPAATRWRCSRRFRPSAWPALAADRKFLRRLGDAADDLRDYLASPRWYQDAPVRGDRPGRARRRAACRVAYFSPEYGITAALPQYSGGLGILAGDHLKAASDLGVPLIGVGLLYRHGYFTQSLSAEGWQAERYPASDPNGLPLTLLRDGAGAPVRIWVGAGRGRRRWPLRSGSPRSAGFRCCCSTPTWRRTSPPSAR